MSNYIFLNTLCIETRIERKKLNIHDLKIFKHQYKHVRRQKDQSLIFFKK